MGIPKTATYKVSSDVKFIQTSVVNSVRKLELKSLVYEVRHFISNNEFFHRLPHRFRSEVMSANDPMLMYVM